MRIAIVTASGTAPFRFQKEFLHRAQDIDVPLPHRFGIPTERIDGLFDLGFPQDVKDGIRAPVGVIFDGIVGVGTIAIDDGIAIAAVGSDLRFVIVATAAVTVTKHKEWVKGNHLYDFREAVVRKNPLDQNVLELQKGQEISGTQIGADH